jgi:chromosome segregation ATPase
MLQQFDELLDWQVELADTVVQLQNEIGKYEEVENHLLKRREKELLHHFLGLKNELKEVEYGLHYIQQQLKEKNNELSYLQEDCQRKVEDIITYYKSSNEIMSTL